MLKGLHVNKRYFAGDSGVGKTTLVRRFMGDAFTAETVPTEEIDLNVKRVSNWTFPANTRHSSDAVSMLGQRRRQCANIKTALGECLVLAGLYNAVHNPADSFLFED